MRLLKLIFFALSLSAHALEFNDVLTSVSVIKSYEDNFLVINRGLEDGIVKGDHIKLTNQNGYIARAICIKTAMLISHWKVYRVVNPELLSFDETYRIKSMNQSKIPDDLSEFRVADFSYQYNDISDEDLKKPLNMQQERIIKFDLANDLKDDPILVEAEKTETDRFLEKNFDQKQFAEDFSNINLSFFTSPISWQRQADQKSINYGMSISNIGEKYELSFNLNKMDSKVVDQYSGSEITSESTSANVVFDINRITENFSYFMFASYFQSRTGDTYNPRRQLQGGLLGLKYHIIDNGPIVSKFDISYITLIDYLEFDSQGFDENTFESFTFIETQRNTRHSFRLRLRANLSDQLSFNSVLWYKPYMYLKDQRIDWTDTQTDWTSDLSWRISENLNASFQYQYTYDIRQLRNFQIDPMNQINTINLNYTFNL